jgi:hypothetical protein
VVGRVAKVLIANDDEPRRAVEHAPALVSPFGHLV